DRLVVVGSREKTLRLRAAVEVLAAIEIAQLRAMQRQAAAARPCGSRRGAHRRYAGLGLPPVSCQRSATNAPAAPRPRLWRPLPPARPAALWSGAAGVA